MKKTMRKIFNNREWQLKRQIARQQKNARREQDDFITLEDVKVLRDARDTADGKVLIAYTDITGLDESEEEL